MSEFYVDPNGSPNSAAVHEYHKDRLANGVRRSSADVSTHVELVRGSTITPEPIAWLWQGWLARGKAHILGGSPGAGKTTISGSLAAIVSTGASWPDGSEAPVGNVIIWSGEDDPKDTLAPRLIAAGADMRHIFFVGQTREEGKARSFNPAKDIEPLRAAIQLAGGAALLIVDPVVNAVGGDSHKNADVRKGLQPLVDLAANENAALLGITHFSKGTAGREPTERITGSLAFAALARIVLIAAKIAGESEDEPSSRLFMRSKSNIGQDDGGFHYQLRQLDLENFPGISASYVEWGEKVDGSARDVLSEAEATPERNGSSARDAATFLLALLNDGPLPSDDIKDQAAGAGLSWATVRRAQTRLGVVSRREGYGSAGRWFWSLPDH